MENLALQLWLMRYFMRLWTQKIPIHFGTPLHPKNTTRLPHMWWKIFPDHQELHLIIKPHRRCSCFFHSSPWNILPQSLKEVKSVHIFERHREIHLFPLALTWIWNILLCLKRHIRAGKNDVPLFAAECPTLGARTGYWQHKLSSASHAFNMTGIGQKVNHSDDMI